MVEVDKGVICRWRVVWGERGRLMESWVGDVWFEVIAVDSGGICDEEEVFGDLEVMRGMLGDRFRH